MKPVLSISLVFLFPGMVAAHSGHLTAFTPEMIQALASGPSFGSGASALNQVRITVENGFRVIQSNGLPNHPTGRFPNRNNPNSISEQRYQFRVPAEPRAADRATALGMHPFGVAVNGVVFDPGAAEWWNRDRRSGWQYEPLSGAINLGVDQNNAHVQPTGAYHYHGLPVGLIRNLLDGKMRMILVGWAADGFPIYGPWGPTDPMDLSSPIKQLKPGFRIKEGVRPSGPGGRYDGSFVEDWEWAAGVGDLDALNGRFGVTPEFPQGIYHYYLSDAFPYIPRAYKGRPDASFMRHGPPPGGGRGPGGPGGRRGGPPGPGRGGPGGFPPPPGFQQ